MNIDTIELGSAIPETIEGDEVASKFFGFQKPRKVLIVEGTTDKEVIENYLYLAEKNVDFSIRSANMIDEECGSGKDAALQYYDKYKESQEIKVLLDRDYDFICSSQRIDNGILYYDYYELENYFFEEKVLKSVLISNNISLDKIDKIMSFFSSKNSVVLPFLVECSKLRIFRKLHKEKVTPFQLEETEIQEFAKFIKNIDIRGCIKGLNPTLSGESFTERLDFYLNTNLNLINSRLCKEIQEFFDHYEDGISYPETLIDYFRYFFKGKDSLKFISDLLVDQSLIDSNLNYVSSKDMLKTYIFQSDLYKNKIEEVIGMFPI